MNGVADESRDPKGERGCIADVVNGESWEGVATDGKWGGGCVTEIWQRRCDNMHL